MLMLTPVMRKFVLHWGEMGTRWGVNRTVAQVHALLYLAPEPLNAEQIAETLSISRSNVSTSVRELLNWGIVKTVQVLGDRRTHYETLGDVWRMFQILIEERKQREIDPTVAVLRECVDELDVGGDATSAHSADRLRAMLSFFEAVISVYEQARRLDLDTIRRFAESGARVRQLIAQVG